MKKLLSILLIPGLLILLLTACDVSRGDTNTATSSTPGSSGSGGNMVTVHTDTMSFAQSSIILQKGQSLQLVNDAADIHMIAFGTWQQGTAKAEQNVGAPRIQNEQLNANGNMVIGPWNIAGTYHLYCPVHMNMNLTVYVK